MLFLRNRLFLTQMSAFMRLSLKETFYLSEDLIVKKNLLEIERIGRNLFFLLFHPTVLNS